MRHFRTNSLRTNIQEKKKKRTGIYTYMLKWGLSLFRLVPDVNLLSRLVYHLQGRRACTSLPVVVLGLLCREASQRTIQQPAVGTAKAQRKNTAEPNQNGRQIITQEAHGCYLGQLPSRVICSTAETDT